MKKIDTSNAVYIYPGEIWKHPLPPCNKEMIKYLESDERIVSWIQPEGKGIEDQIPTIRLSENEHYTLSLRMMKAVWKHVRLKQEFKNIEKAPYGGCKPKIPHQLLMDKLKTQARFAVSKK